MRVYVFARRNGMCVYRVAEQGWVAACRDGGIGNGVCLCVPLLSQRETRQLSPITPPFSVYLTRLLALFPAHSLFLFIFLSSPLL